MLLVVVMWLSASSGLRATAGPLESRHLDNTSVYECIACAPWGQWESCSSLALAALERSASAYRALTAPDMALTWGCACQAARHDHRSRVCCKQHNSGPSSVCAQLCSAPCARGAGAAEAPTQQLTRCIPCTSSVHFCYFS